MTHYIGNVPIAAIQNIEIVEGEKVDEVDLVDKNVNIVLSGNDEGSDVSIEFTLAKEAHQQNLSIEEQKNELKTLFDNDAVDNSFTFDKFEGALSIEGMSFPESADNPTIIQGSIEGKYLPWPKHHPSTKPSHRKRIAESVDYVLDSRGNINKAESAVGNIALKFEVDASLLRGKEADGTIDFALDIGSPTANKVISASSDAPNYSLDILGKPNKVHSLIGSVEYDYYNTANDVFGRAFGTHFSSFDPILTKRFSTTASADYSLDSTGDMAHYQGPFGGQFGRSFGGSGT